jgi:hypothetical protein
MNYDIMGYTYKCADISAKHPLFVSEADQEDAEKHGREVDPIIGWNALASDIEASDAAVGDKRKVGPRIAQRAARFIGHF